LTIAQTAPVITIDGPSGAGKGTVCRLLAKQLGWQLLDSGALYRLTALAAQQASIALDDDAAVAQIAADLQVEFASDADNNEQILLAGNNVTPHVRAETTGELASQVAVHPAVRHALVELQHGFRQMPGLVADGRDKGTVIFPDAPLKLFLTASAQERAERRAGQLRQMRVDANIRQLFFEIQARDERDQTRKTAPLLPAPDAVLVDTTGVPIPEVMTKITALVEQRFG